jgi:site-specific DNA-methyltransferase (adenine-specific)
MMPKLELLHGDCLEVMKDLPDGSVDMVLTDPPYGTTACKWDSVIPFEPMWEQLKRITKKNGAIVMTASQPFTSALVMSNVKMFKYCWIWGKGKASNFFAAKFQPLNNTEDVVVFSTGGCNNGTKQPVPYNPQGVVDVDIDCINFRNHGGAIGAAHKTTMLEGRTYKQTKSNYPFKTLRYKQDKGTLHPTQKPVALMEYLIKTYTNEGETVLDFTMGSGTTGVACKNLNRNFIGIELDSEYFEIARQRIETGTVAKRRITEEITEQKAQLAFCFS